MVENIELRHLRAFVAVATELNFSRAARGLHLAQQSLSTQIQQLERELAVQLLVRTTRRVELTDAGRVFLEHARTVLEQMSTAVERTRRVAGGEIGRLSLSYTPTLAADTLPVLMAAVHRRCPDLSLRVSEMWQAESVEAVRAGRLDAGLARYPEVPAELASVRIRDEPLGVVLSAAHPLAGQEVLDPVQLGDATLVIWPRDFSPGFFDRVLDAYRSHGFRGRIHELELLTSGSFLRDPGALALVSTGEGFTVAFDRQFDPLPPDFVWRPVEPAPRIAVHLYWRREATPAVRRLIDVTRGISRAEGWLVGPS
ncbi:LysR family transcriptional regulator [Pseudonocardia broussonetiae]|uniref:LysR family transcriptional regulator n=1 Tax=Pseudonocardia broussonetiae TaxID=2736640 RepID=A0A6M6JQ76_9PSEU|nr:LysR substrate-binding domain-containing protein [Pseudonocardia broussonetiae]QJY49400.1 LysR family transcriptional regulator [Pseudonocardia broussonetiae]